MHPTQPAHSTAADAADPPTRPPHPPAHLSGRMADTLPHTDAALVAQCQRDYESAASMGGQQALDACFRCVRRSV